MVFWINFKRAILSFFFLFLWPLYWSKKFIKRFYLTCRTLVLDHPLCHRQRPWFSASNPIRSTPSMLCFSEFRLSNELLKESKKSSFGLAQFWYNNFAKVYLPTGRRHRDDDEADALQWLPEGPFVPVRLQSTVLGRECHFCQGKILHNSFYAVTDW